MATDIGADRSSGDRGLLDSLPCGVISFDDSGRVLYANGTVHTMLGYTAGELEGGHVERLLTIAGRIL